MAEAVLPFFPPQCLRGNGWKAGAFTKTFLASVPFSEQTFPVSQDSRE